MAALRLLTAVIQALLVPGVFLSAGGAVIVLACDTPDPGLSRVDAALPGLAMTAGLLVLMGGAWAVRHRWNDRRRPEIGLVLGGVVLALVLGELGSRAVVAPWPARDLHGVSPAMWREAAQSLHPAAAASPEINSWGQRDRERDRIPAPGTFRVAFLGDSFLEEGAGDPVSLRTERLLEGVEVINLGVSATGPDEYYERLRGVALPLKASRCYVFVFAGNDFITPPRTLPSWQGIAAVSPRPSFLSTIGLQAGNHLLTNRQRPVFVAWMSGAGLAQEERDRAAALREAGDDEIRAMLLSAARGLPDAQVRRLAERLQGSNDMFDMLRRPDGGCFRSHYLSHAVTAALDGDRPWGENPVDDAVYWMRAAAETCRSRNVPLTVVVIPEGAQVDDRMAEQWRPLANLRALTRACRLAADRFVNELHRLQIDVIDLHDVLQGTRGTYLNLDGHWSESGTAIVAEVLADHLRGQLNP